MSDHRRRTRTSYGSGRWLRSATATTRGRVKRDTARRRRAEGRREAADQHGETGRP